MAYRLSDEKGRPLDAHIEIQDGSVILHSRSGGTASKPGRNADYSDGLRLILRRLSKAGIQLDGAWVDSTRVQALPLDDRRVLSATDNPASPEESFSLITRRMEKIGQERGATHGNRTRRLLLKLTSPLHPTDIAKTLGAVKAQGDFSSELRLGIDQLARVTSEDIYDAVHKLLDGASHNFGESTDYDVLVDGGTRLAPKAVFGLAASSALGFQVLPIHFSAGLGTACFKALEEAGYKIVAKDARSAAGEILPPSTVDHEWQEGSPRLRTHLRRERKALGGKKKAQFKAEHDGKIFCEKCGMDPIAQYGAEFGEACIEVHHQATQVQHMSQGHATKLEHLQCLCANCHRIEHRRLNAETSK